MTEDELARRLAAYVDRDPVPEPDDLTVLIVLTAGRAALRRARTIDWLVCLTATAVVAVLLVV